MTRAKVWIENNPETGNIKPYEVFFQADGHKHQKVASCQTYESAEKSMAKMVARNSKYYDFS